MAAPIHVKHYDLPYYLNSLIVLFFMFGFGHLPPIASLDDQPGTTSPQFQPVGRKGLVNILPGLTLLQNG